MPVRLGIELVLGLRLAPAAVGIHVAPLVPGGEGGHRPQDQHEGQRVHGGAVAAQAPPLLACDLDSGPHRPASMPA